ncbi:MAG: helix-turn-helix domain-containing protein [Dysgonamonadaceae bacterium]|nr:helix-turn-helix domain-containing protein [Dysgonamonadaceae bacterium]
MENFNDILNRACSPTIKKIVRGNFTKVSNNLIDSCDLDGYEKMVLIALERFNYGKNKCWASQETIAIKSGFSKTKIKNVLKELEIRGFVIKVKDKKFKTNTYHSTTNIYRPPDVRITDCDKTYQESPRVY